MFGTADAAVQAQTVLNAQGVLNAGLSLPLTALALLPRWLAFVVAVMWAVRRALRKNATRAARKKAR